MSCAQDSWRRKIPLARCRQCSRLLATKLKVALASIAAPSTDRATTSGEPVPRLGWVEKRRGATRRQHWTTKLKVALATTAAPGTDRATTSGEPVPRRGMGGKAPRRYASPTWTRDGRTDRSSGDYGCAKSSCHAARMLNYTSCRRYPPRAHGRSPRDCTV